MNTPFQWRKDYEPFRGHVWNYGNYQIAEKQIHAEDTIFIGEHAGREVARSRFWIDVAMACERHANQ